MCARVHMCVRVCGRLAAHISRMFWKTSCGIICMHNTTHPTLQQIEQKRLRERWRRMGGKRGWRRGLERADTTIKKNLLENMKLLCFPQPLSLDKNMISFILATIPSNVLLLMSLQYLGFQWDINESLSGLDNTVGDRYSNKGYFTHWLKSQHWLLKYSSVIICFIFNNWTIRLWWSIIAILSLFLPSVSVLLCQGLLLVSYACVQ